MTIEEAIKILESGTEFPPFHHTVDELDEACKMAVTALYAQHIPAKLDRSQWKGCELCNANIYVKVKKYLRPLLAPATYVGELRDKLEDLTGEAYTEVPKKYCPICGRALTEEAWAELERRLGVNDEKAD